VSSDQSGLLKPANRMVNLGVQGNELKTRGYRLSISSIEIAKKKKSPNKLSISISTGAYTYSRIVPTSSQALLPLDDGTNDSVKLPLREIGNFHLRAIICLTLLVRNSQRCSLKFGDQISGRIKLMRL